MHFSETLLGNSPVHLLTVPSNCAGGTLGSIKCLGSRLLPKEHIPDNVPEAPPWRRQCREEPQGAASSIAHALRINISLERVGITGVCHDFRYDTMPKQLEICGGWL